MKEVPKIVRFADELRNQIRSAGYSVNENAGIGYDWLTVELTFTAGSDSYKVVFSTTGSTRLYKHGMVTNHEISTTDENAIVEWVNSPDKYRLVISKPENEYKNTIIDGFDIVKPKEDN